MAKVADIKTKQTDANVNEFIAQLADQQKQKDCMLLLKMMEKATKSKAKIWGSSIIGFGNKRYKSPATGREVDWFIIGFAPRKANLTVYLLNMSEHATALKKLGKHKTGGGCLYIHKLADVDVNVLERMIQAAVEKQAKN